MKKTIFQKIYSFFGFWTYRVTDFDNVTYNYQTRMVIYWCCFPFFYIRKFDLFSYKINNTFSS